jgi:hypothetical protein
MILSERRVKSALPIFAYPANLATLWDMRWDSWMLDSWMFSPKFRLFYGSISSNYIDKGLNMLLFGKREQPTQLKSW